VEPLFATGTKTVKQPGLDKRHRDETGQISRKHGNTRVSTLREKYGETFAAGVHGNAKLSTVLDQLDKQSLSQLLRTPRKSK